MLIQADASMTYNLTGKVFGRLTVLEPQPGKAGKELRWLCQCVCGKQTVVRSYCLRKGSTKSCGCLLIESRYLVDHNIHGYYNTPTYHTWEGMKQRCLNPNATRYREYGAKGIKVCDRWLDFTLFLEDMGERPPDRTLDRINPFGNYEPTNCRWATKKEQQNNQRRHYKKSEEVIKC